MNTIFETLPYTLPAVLIAIILHEWAHGFISYKLGDPSPKLDGRLSLNPLKHLDPFGTLCLLLFRFGWAKPVMVNANYYKDPKMGMVLTALAGPIMNFILAFVFALLFKYIVLQDSLSLPFDTLNYLFYFFWYSIIMNVGLGLFNLIPVPPLDGSKAFLSFLPKEKYFSYMRFEQYGMLVLFVLLGTGILSPILNSLSSGFINGIFQIVSIPLTV